MSILGGDVKFEQCYLRFGPRSGWAGTCWVERDGCKMNSDDVLEWRRAGQRWVLECRQHDLNCSGGGDELLAVQDAGQPDDRGQVPDWPVGNIITVPAWTGRCASRCREEGGRL